VKLSYLASLLALAVAACASPQTRPAADTETTDLGFSPVGFDRLPGWRADHLSEAVPVFAASCGRMKDPSWRPACAAARRVPAGDDLAARQFFEANFQPYQASGNGSTQGLFTGYYEPELQGSRTRKPGYDTPLYGVPPGGRVTPDRASINRGALAGRALERFWVSDPIDAFFMEIQGSGRIRLPSGEVARVTYAGQNNRPYVAVGKVLIDRGEIARENMSLQAIRAWMVAHPDQAQSLMERNPSYVFFRELPPMSSDRGPPGAMEIALTPGRSIAVDRAYTPLGTPVWLDTTNAINGLPIQRLMVAQDTGGAIKGVVRADIFLGWGPEAAELAGRMKQSGAEYLLVPRTAPAPFTS